MHPRAHPLRNRRSADRRPGTSPGRRLGVMLVVVAAAAGATGDVAAADTSAPIFAASIHEQGGGIVQESASLAQLQQCPEYSGPSTMVEYGRQGAVPVTLAQPGPQTGAWSLASVLGCLQPAVPTAGVTGVVVVNADGTPETDPGSELTPADLASPSDFTNADENPVFSDIGSSVDYDRPWRGGSDLDFDDEIVESPPVSIDVFEGPMLTVTAGTSTPTVKAGTPVTFLTQVSGNNGSPLSYAWNFGSSGAPSSTAASPQETFTVPGTYTVTLEVTDGAGGGGGDTLSLTVTGGPNADGNAPKGPTRSPTKQPGSGTKQPAGGHHPQSNGHTNANSSHTKTTQTTQTATTTAAGTSTAASTTTPAASPTATAPATPPHRPARSTHRTAQRTLPPRAPIVTGRLVSDIVALPAASSPLVYQRPAPATPAPAERPPKARSVLTGLAVAAVVLALLGLGAGRELRGRRRWRALRAGS